jgi:preprotein translocase subunit YajC
MKRTFYYALFIVALVGTMWFLMWRETEAGTLKDTEFGVGKMIKSPRD